MRNDIRELFNSCQLIEGPCRGNCFQYFCRREEWYIQTICLAPTTAWSGGVSYNNTTPAFLKECFWSEQWHLLSRTVYFMTSYACPFSASSFPNIFLLQPYPTVLPHCTLKKATGSLVFPDCHYSLTVVHYLTYVRAPLHIAAVYRHTGRDRLRLLVTWSQHNLHGVSQRIMFHKLSWTRKILVHGCVENAKSSLRTFWYRVPFLIRFLKSINCTVS